MPLARNRQRTRFVPCPLFNTCVLVWRPQDTTRPFLPSGHQATASLPPSKMPLIKIRCLISLCFTRNHENGVYFCWKTSDPRSEGEEQNPREPDSTCDSSAPEEHGR